MSGKASLRAVRRRRECSGRGTRGDARRRAGHRCSYYITIRVRFRLSFRSANARLRRGWRQSRLRRLSRAARRRPRSERRPLSPGCREPRATFARRRAMVKNGRAIVLPCSRACVLVSRALAGEPRRFAGRALRSVRRSPWSSRVAHSRPFLCAADPGSI
ncbi:hypothetical protein DO71_6062 [Burkholderia pseudomallei]|nr:hypothetical protein DO71_6062 [Burkholderia pseudomallei]